MKFLFRYRPTIHLLLSGWLWCALVVPQAAAQERPSTQTVTIERKLIDGKKYILLGDWEKAEALFRAILEEDVQNSAAAYELSRTLAARPRGGDPHHIAAGYSPQLHNKHFRSRASVETFWLVTLLYIQPWEKDV